MNMRLDFVDMSEEKLKEAAYALERCEKDHGLTFTVLEKDRAEAVLPVRKEHLNLYNMVYGGFVFNLMDVVAGIANVCGGNVGPTVSGNIEYISSTQGQKTLRCIGTVRKSGRTFSYIDVEVLGADEKLLSKGTFIYYNR